MLHKVERFEVENCGLRKHLKLGDFDDIFTRNDKKHLVVEWLSWLPCKRDFINSTILETYEDIPNPPPSLNLSEQRVYELVGGGGFPLNPPLDNFVGAKGLDQEGLKYKFCSQETNSAKN